MNDNQMMTTPIPEDLQLSESITSVYLHNSSKVASLVYNIKTTETPKMGPVNSITLVPFSKLTNQILDSERNDASSKMSRQQEPQQPTTTAVVDDNIYTVTPVSVSQTTTTTTTTTTMQYDDQADVHQVASTENDLDNDDEVL